MSHKTFRKNKDLSFQLQWPELWYRKKQGEGYLSLDTRIRFVVRRKEKPCILFGISVLGFGGGFIYEVR